MHLAIVGNSAAALSALDSFRERDQTSSVTLVCDEAGPAYSRVLLPYYLRRKLTYDALFIRQMDYYARQHAGTVFGARVERVDAATRKLELADGRSLGFDQLLLATGSSPARPPIPGLDGAGVYSLWTVDDAARLDPLFRVGARVLVLGSGFVALQAAWAARERGLAVTVVELDGQILPRVLDAQAARILHERILAHGVDVHTGTRTDGLETDRRGQVHVSARGLSPFSVDAVIVATGARPNDGLLPECLEPGEPGIPVAATMETLVDGVFAAGDVTRGPTAAGGPREIHALWPTAVEQGKVAGANLAGAGLVYGGSLSMNVTEMFGLTVASLGRFVEDEADDVSEWRDLAGIDYLKVVSRAGVPVGAISLGEPEGAALLGRLRPFVRQKRAVNDMLAFLEGRDLDQRLVGVAATKEESSCASLL
jgi:NADPH-dependent 2,4-dienoyl-CoA reductase/sulfur reductase-like enzyme